jgi:hypothetical protein
MEEAENVIAKDQRCHDYPESEDQSWSTDDQDLLDPVAIEPRMQIVDPDRGWGFHARAELLNGRLAMVGFAAALIMELITGQGILQQLGLKALSK